MTTPTTIQATTTPITTTSSVLPETTTTKQTTTTEEITATSKAVTAQASSTEKTVTTDEVVTASTNPVTAEETFCELSKFDPELTSITGQGQGNFPPCKIGVRMNVGELCSLKCNEDAGFESEVKTLRCQPNGGLITDPVRCKRVPRYYYYYKSQVLTSPTSGPSTSLRRTTAVPTVDSLTTSIHAPTTASIVLRMHPPTSKTIAPTIGPSSAATTANMIQPMNISAAFSYSEESGLKAVDTWFFALVAVVLLVVLMVGEIVFVSFFLALKNKKQAT